MQLLVSVKDAIEAAAALDGGADIIDAKDPDNGALAAVAVDVFREIHGLVGGVRLVTAALGDAVDAASAGTIANEYARAGAKLVKIGFAGIASHARVATLLAAARDGAAGHAGVIATAYADADRVASLDPFAIVDAAAAAAVTGVLLDTADKQGPGLGELMSLATLRAWVAAARDARLLVAVAGKLTADDFAMVNDAGTDIVGVRGAACDNGRTGRISAAHVHQLTSVVARRSARAPVPGPAAAYE
jgi:uncharacterized protein (UPF0264 family)